LRQVFGEKYILLSPVCLLDLAKESQFVERAALVGEAQG
jgi:hypothetical protein